MASYTLMSSGGSRWWRVGRFGNTQYDWATEWARASREVAQTWQHGWYVSLANKASIIRTPFFFDTTSLTDNVVTAYLRVRAYNWNWGGLTSVPDSVCLVSCPDIGDPPATSDYGYLRTCTTQLATAWYVAVGMAQTWHTFELNADGRAAINKGGITKMAFRSLTDLSYDPQTSNKSFGFAINYPQSEVILYVNPVGGGYLWVEDTYLAYADALTVKRVKEGIKEGATGQTAGYIWIEGDNLRYIDSSGDERYIAGSAGAASSQTAGHIWFEGSELHYIDSSGNERYFEGS